MEKNCIDLLMLQNAVKAGIEAAVPGTLWVKAELASVSRRRNGHCYMDLVQSDEGAVVAQARAIIWAGVYGQLSMFFESVTGSPLQAGQQLLLAVRVNYSPVYGVSLIVEDIDPDYTVGDAERKRLETLERLRKEGLLETQKEFALPVLPYRFAVVSAPDAAGYRDFMRHLHENAYGFKYSTTLYPASMQGAECASSIAAALAEIASSGVDYDAVLILRGGGGKLDLACYDEYEMCAAVARHPFPVLTAIGHDQDTHLCDMVAFESVKTPTALADYFIEIYADEDARLYDLGTRLKNARRTRLALMEGCLNVLKARLEAADPRRLLEKGYVLALGPDDHPLGKAAGVKAGDRLTLMLADGKIRTEVKKVEL